MEALNVPDLQRLVDMDDRDGAITELQQALDDDRLWRVSMFNLPAAADFAADPRVAAILAQARARLAALNLRPEVLVEPAAATGVRPLLLVLHGARGNAQMEMAAFRPAAGLGYTVVAAQSSQPATPTGFCWDPPRERVMQDLRVIAARLPVHGRLILAGFSQGAWIALEAALDGGLLPAAGVILVAPFVGAVDLLPGAARRLHVHIIAGVDDPLAERIGLLDEHLQAGGHHLHVERIAGLGHRYPADFQQRLPALLRSLTRRS